MDMSRISSEDLMRMNLLTLKYLVRDEQLQKCGLVIVEDLQDFTLGHAMSMQRHMDRSVQGKMMAMMQVMLPHPRGVRPLPLSRACRTACLYGSAAFTFCTSAGTSL